MKIDLAPLVTWFDKHKRDLPWREDQPNPYRIWVSEVMLQQTQVKTVIPYFESWMQKFPTLTSLAEASEEDVIKQWEGLGYYSRARNLHAGAKACLLRFNGLMPTKQDDIASLKGIGPYTLGAILSFAYHKKAVALDGNVLRVMSRLISEEGDIALPRTKKVIETSVLQSLPDDRPWVAMEALIELGALICTPKPNCIDCPLLLQCTAVKKKLTHSLPFKKKSVAAISLTRAVLILIEKNHVLLKQEKEGKIMQGLWEFPYFENVLPENFGPYDLNEVELLPKTKHSFTKYHVTLLPHLVKAEKKHPIEGYTWISFSEMKKLAFSSGHRKLISHVLKDN